MSEVREFRIGSRLIGDKHPTYIIAEVGLAHQGDVKMARALIDAAKNAGADCVKFQKRSMQDVYKSDVLRNPQGEEHAQQYLLEHIIKNELSENEMKSLAMYAKKKGIRFACTPWDEKSMRFLNKLGVQFFKIGSPDMFNLPLLRKVARMRKPMLISTGMSFVSEIEHVAKFLEKEKANYMFLHCNSTYPAPYYDINLAFLPRLKEISGGRPVGYSGHESGIAISIAAVAFGARVIEKHITLDRTLPGPDHKASLEPDEFKELVRGIRATEIGIGEPVRYPSRGEFLNRENLSKSLVAARAIKKGSILSAKDITVKSPGKGTTPIKYDYFIGSAVTTRDIKKDDYILESDVGLPRPPSDIEKLTFNRKWGVVGRMTDIDTLLHLNSDFVEIHLSDSDIHHDRVGTTTYDRDLVVHGPEYDGDLLLDLSSRNKETRRRSVAFFNKALDHARRLKKNFRNRDGLVKVVIHPGGMDMERPLLEHKKELNANLLDSLSKLHDEGLQLLVENMPGSPWYFGGTWHHANFMDAEEIAEFSKKTGYGIVFDTSHAALYCNRYGKKFEDFVKTILPVTKYIHVSDAANWGGEGLRIGDGAIDFKMLLAYLVRTKHWILPEIWQGHKFGGEGFAAGMKALKTIDPRF
ncbi:hypothetical protein A3A40_02650 [Candidatus Kaiserbacteria bacterium RIFCSPLOWO2_01_FULL_54_20]|uniref:AFP-like domain-containing protein n=1 Tax=Candidatus Kaiserbacteria bacterium RIFCSPLOWO2_01_FULL_54_20 TaxID=1798513 RepID=A0A1F6EJS4_9BACT|nr:MAG: hypothetical protein A3A40_02650 [Candidatus Kaiserbacteria bacterium RIFCSPLOWO2_01_FULL_54_20]